MSRSQSGRKRGAAGDQFFTPRSFIDALGPFDLDPCTSEKRPWDTARQHFTHDGLEPEWAGFVWLNPPYSGIAPWLKKLAAHGDGIALVPAATGAKYWDEFVYNNDRAWAITFVSRRIAFCKEDGSSRDTAAFYCALIGYGARARNRLLKYDRARTWDLTN